MDNIFIFHGANQASARQELSKWQQGFKDKHGEFNLESFTETPNSKTILATAQTLPLFGEKRLIVIHDYFGTQSKEDQEELITKFANIPESTILVFFETKALDKRLKSTKALLKAATNKEFPALNKNNLPEWIKSEVSKHEQSISYTLAMELSHQFSEHPDLVPQEINKLCTFASNSEINKEAIKAVNCLPHNDSVFDLTDALASNNNQHKLRTLSHLYQQGEDLVRLLYLLTSQIRLLIITHLTKGNFSEVKALKIHPYVQKKLKQKVRNLSLKKLYELYRQLYEIDLAIKTGKIRTSKGNQSELLFAMERFLVS